MAYDAKDRYAILAPGGQYRGGTWLNDTWKLVAGNWTEIAPNHGPSPTVYASAAYDAKDSYVVMVGGCILYLGCPKETWTFVSGNWSKISPNPSPDPSLQGAAMAYDAKDGYLVLFGGSQAVSGGSFDTNYTWTFAGGKWTNLTPKHSPSPRYGATMTYDGSLGRILMFGGGYRTTNCGSFGTCPMNDTWAFSGGRWARIVTAPTPHARYLGAMAFDPQLGCSVLFGGFGSVNSGPLNDTWAYCNQRWSNVSPARSPVPQYYPAMIYDPRGHVIVMFGAHPSRWTTGITWTFG